MITATVVTTIGQSLREGFFMFWETLWALVVGFGLSGAVQAFVSRDEMRRALGDHRPGTVAKASGFGMISSSCSYAATAMAKSLFQKGADFIAAMVFMFASTNLVVELGIVLVVLMGWQFAAAEFIGGPIMIGLLVVVGALAFRSPLVEDARRRLGSGSARGAGDDMAGMAMDGEDDTDLQRQPWKVKLRSKAGWADAASYTMADLTMLRKELMVGYAVAGFLAVAVPNSVFRFVFFTGHGFWTSLENVVVGPIVAFVSFVCSIGNVPMAAALYKGGISFGGVISFIFADLIALPLVLIYRKFYGTKLTIRLFVVFWAVMAAAGLIVEGLFGATGLVPNVRPKQIVGTSFRWNYTSVLNIVFLAVFSVLYLLYRNRERLGGGQGYALDPVCGMQVQTANAPASADHDGRTFHFCSDRCQERFMADPHRFAAKDARPVGMEEPGKSAAVGPEDDHGGGDATALDPVCGMAVDPTTATAQRTHEGWDHWFCGPACAERFDSDPNGYVHQVDPVCGMHVRSATAAAIATHDGRVYRFCSQGCADRFRAAPSATGPSHQS